MKINVPKKSKITIDVFFFSLQVYLYPVSVQSSLSKEHCRNRGLIRVSASISSTFVSTVKIKSQNNQPGYSMSRTVKKYYLQYLRIDVNNECWEFKGLFFPKSFTALWVYCALWHFEAVADHIQIGNTSWTALFLNSAYIVLLTQHSQKGSSFLINTN